MSITSLRETSDFSHIAHDLGTPLTAMLGHLQLLREEGLNAAGQRRLAVLEAQVRRMSRLIEMALMARRRSPGQWMEEMSQRDAA